MRGDDLYRVERTWRAGFARAPGTLSGTRCGPRSLQQFRADLAACSVRSGDRGQHLDPLVSLSAEQRNLALVARSSAPDCHWNFPLRCLGVHRCLAAPGERNNRAGTIEFIRLIGDSVSFSKRPELIGMRRSECPLLADLSPAPVRDNSPQNGHFLGIWQLASIPTLSM